MAIFRAGPSDDERAAVESVIKARTETKAKAAEKQPPAEEKQPAGPTDLPITWGKSMRRLSEEEVEAVAGYWRGKYAQYDDPEIQRLGEEKLVAALKADGYAVPKRTEPDRLKLLLRRQAAKGK